MIPPLEDKSSPLYDDGDKLLFDVLISSKDGGLLVSQAIDTLQSVAFKDQPKIVSLTLWNKIAK